MYVYINVDYVSMCVCILYVYTPLVYVSLRLDNRQVDQFHEMLSVLLF